MAMLSSATPALGRAYCNCLALEQNIDPVGHAGDFEDALVIETPLPWKSTLMQRAGGWPQQMIDLLELWLEAYRAGQGYPHLPLAVAADPEYSKPGFRRVMHYRRPKGLFSQFEKVEYLVPDDVVGPLVWALYQDTGALSAFDGYREDACDVRDLLICTHGSVDAACAKFGYPLYRSMRDTYAGERLRIWRVSHFGGHIFAPTLMDMPTGHYWAYVEAEQAGQIVRREGDVTALRHHYRGWAGVRAGFEQAAERALWQRHGWAWFAYEKRGTAALDDNRVEACFEYRLPGEQTAHTARVHVSLTHTVETPHSSSDPQTYGYAQYEAVVELENEKRPD